MDSEEIAIALQRATSRVAEDMEGIVSTMERAAVAAAMGRDLLEIEVGGLQIYLALGEEGREEAVILAMDFEEYFAILNDAALAVGLDLEEAAELEVRMPEAEFGENMVTGGFGEFKGFSVQLRNDILEELLEAVRSSLEERGLIVACVPDEEVIFCLPLRRRGRELGSEGNS